MLERGWGRIVFISTSLDTMLEPDPLRCGEVESGAHCGSGRSSLQLTRRLERLWRQEYSTRSTEMMTLQFAFAFAPECSKVQRGCRTALRGMRYDAF